MTPFFEHKFTPAEIQDLLSVAPTLLRNWRTRGHLDNIGESQGGGRWVYNASDLTKMALVLILQKDRVDLSDAFQFAERIEVDTLIQLHQLDFDGIATRFTSLFRLHNSGEWFSFKVHEAAHLALDVPITTVLDARAFARNIPVDLKAALPVPTTDDLHKLKAELFSRIGPATMEKATGRVDVPNASRD